MDYRTRIPMEPGKCSGKPCIRGLRITVYYVLDYLASGMTPSEILACLAYAADRERHQITVAA